MARQNHGPLSRAKGKLGGIVYQQYEGMQISREYQPNVKNPQSEKQVTNRADFKLASQIVAMYKEVINARLGKLSIYTRTRRGVALETLKRLATTDANNGRQINFNAAVSALNAKSLSEYAAPTIASGTGTITVTAPAGTTIFGVIAGFDTNGNFVGRKYVSAPGTAAAVSFNVPEEYIQSKSMFLYTVPLEGEGRAIFDNISDPTSVFHLDIARLVSAGDIEISDIAGFQR